MVSTCTTEKNGSKPHTPALHNASKRRKLHRGVSGEVNSSAFVLISADINGLLIHQNKWNSKSHASQHRDTIV